MSYELDIDPNARAQIRALPPAALGALVDGFKVLALVPERGEPLNAEIPMAASTSSCSAAVPA